MFDFTLHVITMVAIYGLLALSLNFQLGFGGLVNFGQIALFGCGAYGTGIAFMHQFGPLAGILLGCAFVSMLALFFARLGRSLGADYWGIATLSIGEILRTVATNEDWLTGGAQGIGGIPHLFSGLARGTSQMLMLALILLVLAASWFALHRVTESKFGLSLRLLREEPQLAASLGYDLDGLRRRIMLVGAIPAALAGSLFAHYISFVGPDQMFSSETFVIWTMVIIGGMGNHAGAIIGAILIQTLFAMVPFAKDWIGLSSEYVAALRLLLIGGGLLGFLLWRPQGLIPERVGALHG